MSRRFNFDDFDAQIAEALDEHYAADQKMKEEAEAWDEYERWLEHDTGLRPGDIGAVVLRPTFLRPPAPDSSLPDPPEAA